MALSAGTDLLMDAVNARAGSTLAITALGKVRLDASQNWRESRATHVDSGKWSTTVTHHLRESFTIQVDDYVYAVPFVETATEIFLKTIIPSRKAKRQYRSS